ncbi:hypothetical protein OH76DRAFT_653652 [Lentinus brumalis]|uniref:Uncharacterized protein n=1 Tax=Lentinus brumalis TaxID=2498619 RepID=A0A371D7B8_9APHY|nr:hypothetical protein OH76DRAFT_653652 [Polyporus brumalis]
MLRPPPGLLLMSSPLECPCCVLVLPQWSFSKHSRQASFNARAIASSVTDIHIRVELSKLDAVRHDRIEIPCRLIPVPSLWSTPQKQKHDAAASLQVS